ncbi:MAG: HisA/HisF-related TIM barrel protein [Eubacteriales bacterium]|nr:HisA/HisF-related TIM barrel protein [Eubacteriales bacterium]
MQKKKIIPCLDVQNGRVVKGVNFVGIKELGDPVEFAKKYEADGADELVFLDISATNERRKTMVDLAGRVAAAISIPLTVGGGIASAEDIERLLDAGVAKVSIGTAAIRQLDFLRKAIERFGAEKIVLAIDVKARPDGGWNLYTNGGQVDSGVDMAAFLRQAKADGLKKVLPTGIDTDGMKTGYDIPMYMAVRALGDFEIVASGGCGKVEDIEAVFAADAADAALAASVFHYGELTVREVKEYLTAHGIETAG